MRINKNCPYAEIEDFVNFREEYTMLKYGAEVIGEHFIVLKGPRDITVSFILWGFGDGDYIYKCIYSELKFKK